MDAQSSSERPTPSGRSLGSFRATSKSVKVHPLETAALWAILLHLVFLPWALGGLRLWASSISLGLSLVAFTIALLPRNYPAEHAGAEPFRLHPWRRLVRFPLFWLGLVVFAYIVVGALNPAWTLTQGMGFWWMTQTEHVKWLPAGVRVPFVRGGPWRTLLDLAPIWLTVCSVWISFTRRRTLRWFVTVLVLNGLVLAALGALQRVYPSNKIFWTWVSPNPDFFASFVYRNHAGSYLNLILALTCALAAWYYRRGQRRLEKSNPAGLFAFFATFLAVSIVVSNSRGSTFVMAGFLAASAVAFGIHYFRARHANRRPLAGASLVLVLVLFAGAGIAALQPSETWERLEGVISGKDQTVKMRQTVNQASTDMLRPNWVTGYGAGSYRFLFPGFQKNYPEIFIHTGGDKPGHRFYWEHAHNDYLEFAIEYGAVGLIPMVLGGLYWAVVLAQAAVWRNLFGLIATLGGLVVFGHAWIDFPLQCPAILALWCVLWPTIALWLKFEASHAPA